MGTDARGGAGLEEEGYATALRLYRIIEFKVGNN